jgi:hypothetical protein
LDQSGGGYNSRLTATTSSPKEVPMQRTLIGFAAVVTVFFALAIGAGPAGADPANKNTLHITLDCGTAGTVDAVFQLSSADSFHVISISSNFLWKSLAFVTPSGETGQIDRGIEGDGHQNLVKCTYTGPASGNHYTATGFFTP